MLETEPKAKGHKAEEFMDPSIYNELESSGFFKSMGRWRTCMEPSRTN